jgi:restriction system protein
MPTVENKTVNEVLFAKSQYNGNVGMIITNDTYTESARQYAESCDVCLLHYENLSKFLDSLKKES